MMFSFKIWEVSTKHFVLGDAQLKFVIQWMAATVAGSSLVYYTTGSDLLVKVHLEDNNRQTSLNSLLL